LSTGADVAIIDKMEMVMPPSDIDYFKESAPKTADNNYDYNVWTETMFSR
jgi:hypothetical protein